MWTGTILCCLVTAGAVGASLVTIGADGGYRDVIVKIDKNVKEEKCPDILRGIKALLDTSSLVLNGAVSGLAYFHGVTVVVPSSWRDGKCGVSIKSPNRKTPYRTPDIILGSQHPVHGDRPFTQQSKGCGRPGDFIYLPHTYLTNQNITRTKANLFVHQWAKFRYGIFDEEGFSGDKLYPSYYKRDGQIMPTGSSNVPLKGTWMRENDECDPASEEHCFFVADTSNKDVTCSLGHQHDLPNVVRYCNSSRQNLSPTKHTVLCQGQSAMDVIMSHSDFAAIRVDNEPQKHITPEIKIVREPTTKYILVIETSVSMATNDHWTWINKAAHKFIRYDLPVNSNLAIVTFNDKAKIEHPMVQVTSDAVRARLADTIPGKYHLSMGDHTCTSCAIRKTLDQLLQQNVAGAHIILVSSGNKNSETPQDREKIEKFVIEDHVKISTITTPSLRQLHFYDRLSQKSGGTSFQLSDTGYAMDMLYDLNNAFSRILEDDSIAPAETPQIVHKAEHYSGDANNSKGNFVIDETLGRDTLFGIYVEDEEDHLIKSVEFTDSRGTVYGPFTKMSSTFDLVNLKTINYVGHVPPFGDPAQMGMNWRYSIEWFPTSSRTRKSIVIVTSKPRTREESELVSVKVWTNRDQDDDTKITGDKPLAIFASVTMGGGAVIDADVTLEVEVENENGTIFALSPFRLLDNGLGEPDIEAEDGMYSSYLTKYPSSGRYTFIVRVEAGNQTWTVPEAGVLKAGKCCGSSSQIPRDRLVRTGQFSRSAVGPILELQTAAVATGDTTPPAKIGDLSVTRQGEPGILTAEWTAPGGDFNFGSVASYKFVFSENIAHLLDPMTEPSVLFGVDKTHVAGTNVSQELYFPYYDKDYYIGVYAFDRSGNRGKISNLVHIYVEAPFIEQPETTSAAPVPRLGLLATEKDWMMVGVICGILLVLIAITAASISYFCCVSSTKQQQKGTSSSVSDVNVASSRSSDHTDGTDASSFDSDIKTMNSNHMLPNYDMKDIEFGLSHDLSHAHDLSHSHPIDLSTPQLRESFDQSTRVTPVYWSASQLLSKLEDDGEMEHPYPEGETGPLDSSHPYSYHNESYGYQGYPAHPWPANISSSRNIGTVSGPPPDYFEHRTFIPDEFCVTVSDLGYSDGYSDTGRGYRSSKDKKAKNNNVSYESRDLETKESFRTGRSGSTRDKVPPPLWPKPKNITQV